jgi:hypothetical protein
LFARFDFHELSSGTFQLPGFILSNPLLLAYPGVALAGAPDQITELATSYNLIQRATPRTGRPPVEAATAHRWGMAVTVPAAT